MIMFNPETNRSEDVSQAITQEILRRLGLEGRDVPLELEDFIDRHVGPDRQLTLAAGRAERPLGTIPIILHSFGGGALSRATPEGPRLVG